MSAEDRLTAALAVRTVVGGLNLRATVDVHDTATRIAVTDALRAAGWTLHPPGAGCAEVLSARRAGTGARRSDPVTSGKGDADVTRRAGSQAVRLLRAYARLEGEGATDSEARAAAGLSSRSCYWKRCSELRAEGLIEPVRTSQPCTDGRSVDLGPLTRPDVDTGSDRIVCAITDRGRAYLARFRA